MRQMLPALLLLAACRPAAVPHAEEETFSAEERVEPYTPYATRVASLSTKLAGPELEEPGEPAPPGATEIHYASEVGELRAWYARPSGTKRVPVVVFLHNDFALKTLAWENAQPALAAGYAVLVPGLRGEDGNPGHRELLLGEVRDAKAAVAWARAQPGHDAACVSVIGHSIGGGIAALLSLHPDAGVRRTASVGGIYRAHTFHAWAERDSIRGLVRFDVDDAREIGARLLLPNVREVAIPHIAYAGTDDEYDDRYAALAAERAREVGRPVEHVRVAGDHMSSIGPALADFLARDQDCAR
jgi:dienelactone hydrolase